MSPTAQVRPLRGAPVLVAAPTTRCGTTLLQRVFNSGSNSLLFGEDVTRGLVEALWAYVVRLRGFEEVRETNGADLQRALAGEQFWCPDLLPDVDRLLEHYRDSVQRYLDFLSAEAHHLGRPVWGGKRPGLSVSMLCLVRQLIPDSRVIYLGRDVRDVARSAKARGFLKSEQDVAGLAQSWAAQMNEVEQFSKDAGSWFVRYEDLVADPEDALRRLEALTGARDLDREVFGVKLNAFGRASGSYVAPSELSAREQALLEQHAGAARQRYLEHAPTSGAAALAAAS